MAEQLESTPSAPEANAVSAEAPQPEPGEPPRSGGFWPTLLGIALVLSVLLNAVQYQRAERLRAALLSSAETSQGARSVLRSRTDELARARGEREALQARIAEAAALSAELRERLSALDALLEPAPPSEGSDPEPVAP